MYISAVLENGYVDSPEIMVILASLCFLMNLAAVVPAMPLPIMITFID